MYGWKVKVGAIWATLGPAIPMVLCFCVLFPAGSLAAFYQPPLCQIAAGKGGASEAPQSFAPGGIAVDSADRLWVGEPLAGELSAFEPADASCGQFLPPKVALEATLAEPEQNQPFPPQLTKSLMPPANLAIERSSDHIFVTGNGTRTANDPYLEVFDKEGHLVERWERFEFGKAARATIDNSTEPLRDPAACGTPPLTSTTECFVYVAHSSADPTSPRGDGLPPGIERFTSSGEPAPFSSSASCTVPSGYVEGNEITGTPSHKFAFGEPNNIAVDKDGNVYAAQASEVYEFGPCGLFLRKFTGGETPGLNGGREDGGFGGLIYGLAADPVSGLVAVSINRFFFEEAEKDEGAVDEFDPATGRFVGQITLSATSKQLKSADEMTFDAHGDLYVVDGDSKTVNAYGPGRFVPAFQSSDATERLRSSATLNGWIDPQAGTDPESPNPALSGCEFEYVSEQTYMTEGFANASKLPCTPPAAQIASEGWTAVHAHISAGLSAGATYYYRLSASVPGALGGTEVGPVAAFTTPAPPLISTMSATNMSSTFADLNAVIEPRGARTSYWFEYVSDADYSSGEYANATRTPVIEIGSGGLTGKEDVNVKREIGGLEPGSIYHYRVIAESEVEGGLERTVGSSGVFTTLAEVAVELPDQRSYELVTPADKGGGADMFAVTPTDGEFKNFDTGHASLTGDDFLLETNSAFGSFPGMLDNAYVFHRAKALGAWTYKAVAVPAGGVQSTGGTLFDPVDFSQVGVTDGIGSYASEEGVGYNGLAGPPGGPYTSVFTDGQKVHTFGGPHDVIVAGSQNIGVMVIEDPAEPLATGAPKPDLGSQALYEWTGAGECGPTTSNCELISRNPAGTAFKCGAMLGQGPYPGTKRNAVSSDGSVAFFTAPDPRLRADGSASTTGCWDGATANVPQLYMWTGGKSIDVSSPQGVSPAPSEVHPAVYVGASEDGERVFFVTETELTPDAVQADGAGHAPELYEYDAKAPEGARLRRISAGDLGNASEGDVDYVPAVSSDGSVVYFTAFGKLVSGLPTLEEEEVYLYRYDTRSREISYVTTVGTLDYPDANIQSWWHASVTRMPIEIALNSEANWYTSPDGSNLLFSSWRALGGQDTRGPCVLPGSQDHVNGHCTDLYRYRYGGSEGASEITCISCIPSGAAPISNAEFGRSSPIGADALSAGPAHAMSDDGSFVFFDRADPLVAQDSNGTLDVYEWHDGHVSILSSGADAAPSFFLDASPDGSNVFIGTHAQLTPEDTDTNGDIYDARICTEDSPCFKPSANESAQCEGDTCQAQRSPQIESTPTSLTFAGGGNFVPSNAKRGLTQAQKRAKALRAKRAKALRACRSHKRSRTRHQIKRCERHVRAIYSHKMRHASSRASVGNTNRKGTE